MTFIFFIFYLCNVKNIKIIRLNMNQKELKLNIKLIKECISNIEYLAYNRFSKSIVYNKTDNERILYIKAHLQYIIKNASYLFSNINIKSLKHVRK